MSPQSVHEVSKLGIFHALRLQGERGTGDRRLVSAEVPSRPGKRDSSELTREERRQRSRAGQGAFPRSRAQTFQGLPKGEGDRLCKHLNRCTGPVSQGHGAGNARSDLRRVCKGRLLSFAGRLGVHEPGVEVDCLPRIRGEKSRDPRAVEPSRAASAPIKLVARPGVFVAADRHSRVHGVAVDIADNGQQVAVVDDSRRLESTLKEVTHSRVTPIEVARVGREHRQSDSREWMRAGSHRQMNVVTHQTIGVDAESQARICLVETPQKGAAIGVIPENCPALVSPRRDMVHRSRRVNPDRSRHVSPAWILRRSPPTSCRGGRFTGDDYYFLEESE